MPTPPRKGRPPLLTQHQAAVKHGWRSGLEERVGAFLKSVDVPFAFEELRLTYRVEETKKYTPDFLLPNYIIVETKGRFDVADRKKMKLVKEQHPDLDIRLLFANPNAKINKGSTTTYGQWADTHRYIFAKSHKNGPAIPMEWYMEEVRPEVKAAVIELMGHKPSFCL